MPAPHSVANSPFASYDLVVYFGAGAFSLSVILNALPYKQALPKPLPDFAGFEPIVASSAQILFLAFTAYVFGHIVAYVSDQLIEKPLVSVVGYPVSWIGRLSRLDRRNRVRAMVRGNQRDLLKRNATPAAVARFLFHLPLMPIYWLCFFKAGMDGFYRSRIPEDFIPRIDDALTKNDLSCTTDNDEWFRIVEQYVINNHPVATARLYNYVVVYGLLRSLCLTSIILFWLYLFRYTVHIAGMNWTVLVSDTSLIISLIAELIVTYLFYSVLCLMLIFSFGKFYRRYTEEALFSFVLYKEKSESN